MSFRTIRPHNASALMFFLSLAPCFTRHWLSISFDTLRAHCYQPEWKFITVLIWSSGIHHSNSWPDNSSQHEGWSLIVSWWRCFCSELMDMNLIEAPWAPYMYTLWRSKPWSGSRVKECLLTGETNRKAFSGGTEQWFLQKNSCAWNVFIAFNAR